MRERGETVEDELVARVMTRVNQLGKRRLRGFFISMSCNAALFD